MLSVVGYLELVGRVFIVVFFGVVGVITSMYLIVVDVFVVLVTVLQCWPCLVVFVEQVLKRFDLLMGCCFEQCASGLDWLLVCARCSGI